MSDLVLLPDVEQILYRFFRDDEDVAAIAAGRVYAELPKTKVWPAVRLTRYSGAPVVDHPLWFDAARVQVDAFAGPRRTSLLLAETCRAALAARLNGVQYDDDDEPAGVVTGVEIGELRAPVVDDLVTPPVHHALFSAVIYLHP